MRVLFVPFALLLLALCRPSVSHITYSIKSINTKSSKSVLSTSIPPAKKEDAVKAATQPFGAKEPLKEPVLNDLMETCGSMIFIVALQAVFGENGIENLPKYFFHALVNGVLCETQDQHKTKLKQVLGEIPSPNIEGSKAAAIAKDNVDCSKEQKGLNKCYCADKSQDTEYLYCLVLAIADGLKQNLNKDGIPMKKCRADALAALKATGTFGASYDVDGFDANAAFKEIFAGNVDGIDAITKKSSDAEAKFWCDAIDGNVQQAVRDLYAADAAYWIADVTIMTLIFGPQDQSLESACKDSSFTSNNKYGECVCKKDTGFGYCIYHVLAQMFKEAGYLNCDAKKFDAAKQPKALPSFAPPKGAAATATGFFSLALATVALLARQ